MSTLKQLGEHAAIAALTANLKAVGDDCAVLPCGHPLCRRCVCAMCRVSELRGRLHNVLSFARYHGRGAAVTCPLCRTRCPTAHLVCH